MFVGFFVLAICILVLTYEFIKLFTYVKRLRDVIAMNDELVGILNIECHRLEKDIKNLQENANNCRSCHEKMV